MDEQAANNPPTMPCPKHSSYTDCGSACPPLFDTPLAEMCTLQCVSGCFCDAGWVWKDDGDHVLEHHECVQQICPDDDMEFIESSTCVIQCSDNKDCASDSQWCRPTQNATVNVCVDYQQAGESCGGYTPSWGQEKCRPDLICDYSNNDPRIADLPGQCIPTPIAPDPICDPCLLGWQLSKADALGNHHWVCLSKQEHINKRDEYKFDKTKISKEIIGKTSIANDPLLKEQIRNKGTDDAQKAKPLFPAYQNEDAFNIMAAQLHSINKLAHILEHANAEHNVDSINAANFDWSTIQRAYGPLCKPDPCICTKEFKPVCGIDGMTYANDCLADCSNTEVKHEGQCKKECDPNKVCAEATTVVDNLIYPTQCGASNCDEPIACYIKVLDTPLSDGHIGLGETQQSPKGCSLYTCTETGAYEAIIDCPRTECLNPISVKGECCPTCPPPTPECNDDNQCAKEEYCAGLNSPVAMPVSGTCQPYYQTCKIDLDCKPDFRCGEINPNCTPSQCLPDQEGELTRCTRDCQLDVGICEVIDRDTASSKKCALAGDVTGNCKVNVEDIIVMIDFILKPDIRSHTDNHDLYNINNDDTVNINDVLLLVQYVLQTPPYSHEDVSFT